MKDDRELEELKRRLAESLKPDFEQMAQEWLVRAQGHSRPPHEKSLAAELRKLYELGVADGARSMTPERSADADR